MSSQRSNSCWSWHCVRRDGKGCVCAVKVETAECGKQYPSPGVTNFKTHLKNKHNIDGPDHPIVKEMASAGGAPPTKLDYELQLRKLDFFCHFALPLHGVSSSLFRSVTGIEMCRQSLRNAALSHSVARLDHCLKQCRGVPSTLAIDSGTIWRRYLALELIPNNRTPLLIRLVCDTEFDDKRLTADNVAAKVTEVCDFLCSVASAQSIERAARPVRCSTVRCRTAAGRARTKIAALR
jgi:hypothetical protein